MARIKKSFGLNEHGWSDEVEEKKSGPEKRIKDALNNINEAALLRADALDRGYRGAGTLVIEAEELERAADKMLKLTDQPVPVPGGEIVVSDGTNRDVAISRTRELRSQPLVAARASQERLNLVDNADAMVLAVEAAASIENPTPLEQMLIHQLAAIHRMAMELMAQASDGGKSDSEIDVPLSAHLLGQATRLMKTYQTGFQTLMKARKGGKQEVVVQHIHVEKDAQAVVAGKMDYPGAGGGHGNGRGGKQ